MIRFGITENFGSGGHALFELLRERGERCFVHAESLEAVPGERHSYPTLVLIDRIQDIRRRLHGLENLVQPPSATRSFAKGQKLIASGECRSARQQDVLYVVNFQHGYNAMKRRS